MRVTFDANKDILNYRNHGVSLAEAARIDWDNALTWFDSREDDGEDRYIALGLIENRLYYVVFVERDEGLRLISMRKATNTEIKQDVEAT